MKRSPLTGVVFPLELTHAWPLLVPLLIAATTDYLVSALLLKRSVLTEKIARRGLHLSREYAVDPLEVLLVDEVMDAAPLTVAADERLTDVRARTDLQRQWLYPVIDETVRAARSHPPPRPGRPQRPGVRTRGQRDVDAPTGDLP